ncbi:hypothetical protein ACFSC4_09810 [Deinococcus malanensis]|uniref:hypothetical protein n=1 Tax=Deinococcus malanensis TaxID=1706855 RepID=UPI00363C5F21
MLTLLAEADLADATSVATVLRRLENPERTTRVRRNFSRGARIMAYELPGWELIPMLRYLVGKRGQGDRTWMAFERLLAAELTGAKVPVARRYARELTLALRRELWRPPGGTRPNRFGLWWPVTYQGQQPVIHPPRLRFCLPRVWQPVCPVVVLDAYADAAKYTAVFAPVPVRVIRLPAAFSLNVLAAPTLRRHSTDVARGRTPEHLRVIAEMLVDLSLETGRDTLCLAQQGNVQAAYARVLDNVRTTREVSGLQHASLHWWAGRGQNSYTGWHVVALTLRNCPQPTVTTCWRPGSTTRTNAGGCITTRSGWNAFRCCSVDVPRCIKALTRRGR